MDDLCSLMLSSLIVMGQYSIRIYRGIRSGLFRPLFSWKLSVFGCIEAAGQILKIELNRGVYFVY